MWLFGRKPWFGFLWFVSDVCVCVLVTQWHKVGVSVWHSVVLQMFRHEARVATGETMQYYQLKENISTKHAQSTRLSHYQSCLRADNSVKWKLVAEGAVCFLSELSCSTRWDRIRTRWDNWILENTVGWDVCLLKQRKLRDSGGVLIVVGHWP